MLDIEDRVVRALYEAATGALAWPEALHALSGEFDAMVCQYLVVDRASGELAVCEQPHGVAVDALLDYIREYHRIDPHTKAFAARPIGTVLHSAVEFPPERMNGHRFYDEYWKPYGIKSLLGAKVAETGRHIAIGSIVRSVDAPEFSSDEVSLASRYLGHWVAALRIAQRVERLSLTATVGQRMMLSSDRPMLLLSPSGMIAARNPAADRYLAESRLFIATDRLSARDRDADAALMQALQQVTAPGTSGARRALRLGGAGGEVALCTLWDMSAESAMGAFGRNRCVLLSITHPRLGEVPDPQFIGALFELTPAEARLASLLAAGHDLKQIAKMQNLSLHTVRTQLHSVMEKTGTRRQADLVQLTVRAAAP